VKGVGRISWKAFVLSLYVVAWTVIGVVVLSGIPVVNMYVFFLVYAALIYPWLAGGILAGVGALVALVRWTMYLDRRNRELAEGMRS
jgi:hypothetical protein